MIKCKLGFLFLVAFVQSDQSNNDSNNNSNNLKPKTVSKIWSKINLPLNHMPYFFQSNENLRNRCLKDELCPFREQANATNCWGYEPNCQEKEVLFTPECPGDSRGWVILTNSFIEYF
jgi:hypothetical protein